MDRDRVTQKRWREINQLRSRSLTLTTPMAFSARNSSRKSSAPTMSSPFQEAGRLTFSPSPYVRGHRQIPLAPVSCVPNGRVGQREGVVKLVSLFGHGHDRAGAVGAEHVVGDVDRHRLPLRGLIRSCR